MFVGAGLLGLHMAMTHSITVAMIASYMPTGEVKGIGKLSGTAVSFTDFLLGAWKQPTVHGLPLWPQWRRCPAGTVHSSWVLRGALCRSWRASDCPCWGDYAHQGARCCGER